jgi:hypothetical protein
MRTKEINEEQDSVGVDESKVICCIRKRPLFEKEYKNGEFDVITCNGYQKSCCT